MLIGHPVFWMFVAAVAAPLLARVPLGFKVPVVVIEILLGIVLGRYVLDLVRFEGFVVTMFTFGMAVTLFMAGMELDFGAITGRPLKLGFMGWCVSLLIGVIAVGLLHVVPAVQAPLMVTLALCTTGLGVLIPVFRDAGHIESPFGRLIVAAGTMGEVGPIVAMSLLLSQRYTSWQEFGFLLVFIAVVAASVEVGTRARPPRLLALLAREMHASTQLPVRIAMLLIAALFVLAQEFGFESIFGAFAAGLIIGQATRGDAAKPLREKIDAVSFGWFYPFFFVGTGVNFDLGALAQSLTTMLMVPAFVLLILIIRGGPVILYRHDIDKAQYLPFALASAVPSLSVIVVITEIGTKAKVIRPDIAAALIGAALLSVLAFPTIAGVLLGRAPVPNSGSGRESS